MNDKLWCGTILVCVSLLAAAIWCSAYIFSSQATSINEIHSIFTLVSAAVGTFGVILLVSGLFSKSEPRP